MGFHSGRERRSVFHVFLLLVCGALAQALPAHASTLRSLSPDQLALSADQIAVGVVIRLMPHPLDGIDVTDVTLRVTDIWKGQPRPEVTFSVIGSLQGGLLLPADGEAAFRLGEEVVVFLERNSSSGRTWVLGGEQGSLGVDGGRLQTTRLGMGELALRVRSRLAGSPQPLQLRATVEAEDGPRVTGISPKSAGSAADARLPVTIRGDHFGSSPGRVRFPDWFRRLDGYVQDWSDTLIHAIAPRPDTTLQIEVTSGPLEVQDSHGRSSLDRDGCPNYSCRPPSYLDIVYNYPRFRWKGAGEVTWRCNSRNLPDGCGEQAIGRAFETWNEVPGSSMFFRNGGETEAIPGKRDGINAVGSLSPWPFSHAWIAATLPWARYDPDSALLGECDTGLNTDDFSFRCDGSGLSSQPDLQTIMLHESGHWLRLRHVNNSDEIMQASSLLGRAHHELGPGDVAGICHVYPGFGKARALNTDAVVCPAGDADSALIEVILTDRDGLPAAGVSAGEIWADLSGLGLPAGARARAPALGPTDAQGRTRIAVSRLSGPLAMRELPIEARGMVLPRRAVFEALTLDLSGDGVVGPEDLELARSLDHQIHQAGGDLDTMVFHRHMGHSYAGARPPGARTAIYVSPNPFSTTVSIVFSLSRGGPAEVEVLDVTGARIRRLWGGNLGAGSHRLEWDGTTDSGRPAASGIYMVRARLDGFETVRKVLRVR